MVLQPHDRERLENLTLLALMLIYSNAVCFWFAADSADQSLTTSLFVAIQTITTTGYGGAVHFNEDVMRVACIFMLMGAATWGTLIGIVANVLGQQIKSSSSA